MIQTLYRRERRTGTRLAALTLDRGHQSSFLTADERACAETKLHIKIKAGAEDVFTEQAVLTRLVDSNLQTLNGNRVLRTNIYATLGSADSIAGNRHSLNQRVGVALENGTVHECARVALVGVTANILLVGVVACGKFPL